MTIGTLSSTMWNARNVVQDITAASRARSLETYRRRLDSLEAMYDGHFAGYEDLVDQRLAAAIQSGPGARRLIKSHWPRKNWVRKIVNLRSRLYQGNPQRSLIAATGCKPKPRQDELLQPMLDDLDWQRFFRRTERRANLLQSGVVQIVGNGWTGLPQLRFHSLARVWVRQHPAYPNDLDAALGVAIELPDQDDEYAVADHRATARYLRYLPVERDGERLGWRLDLTDREGTVHATYAGDALRKGDVDRPWLPMLPLVKVDIAEGDEFYPVGNDALMDEALDIALREADLGAAQSLAALPMLQARGYTEDDATSISVGPGKVVHHSDPEARLEWLSATTDWLAIDAVNERNLKRFLVTEGVPPTEADLEPQWRSGRALHAARQMLYEERADAMDRWQDHEKAVFAKLARFCAWWFGDMGVCRGRGDTPLPPWTQMDWQGCGLKVSFPNPGPLPSEEEVDELWHKRITAGLASIEEYRREVLGVETTASQTLTDSGANA